MTRKPIIRVDIGKLKVFLCDCFEMSFNRDWDDLPEHVQKEWTGVAIEFAKALTDNKIVEIVDG